MTHQISNEDTIQLLTRDADEGTAATRARRLAELADAMDVPQIFRKGDIVRWKRGLRNRATPNYGEIAIVREVIAVPIFDMCEQARCAGSPYFREPLTLVLAVLDSDGDFLEFRYDGRRFEPAE